MVTPSSKTPRGLEEAVVLSGGGAHGAYQLGVLKALAEGVCRHTDYRKVEPKIYAGTSTGAFNAAVLASHAQRGPRAALKLLEGIWRDKIAHIPGRKANGIFRLRGNPVPYLEPAQLLTNPFQGFKDLARDSAYLSREILHRMQHFMASESSLEKKLFEFPNFADFISVEPMRQLVRESIDPEAIRQSTIKLRLAATCWTSGSIEVFDNASMQGDRAYETVLASTAIPAIFPPQRLGGELYIDGSARMNTPLKPAIKAADPDAEEVALHVIYLDPHTEDVPLPHPPNTLATMYRLYTIMVARTIHQDLERTRRLNESIRHHRLYTHLSEANPDADRGEGTAMGKMEEQRRELAELTHSRREITVHRYEPSRPLGGLLSLLDFKLEIIADLISMGYEDAINHDCKQAQCELSN